MDISPDDTGGDTTGDKTPTDPNGIVSPGEETTPPQNDATPPGGNGAKHPPKHKSGRKPKHHHPPKKRQHVPGHGPKSRNHHGHVTHHGAGKGHKPSTKGTHSQKNIPSAPKVQETHAANQAIQAKLAHKNTKQKTMPVHIQPPKKDEKPKPQIRVAKRSSRVNR